MNIHQRENFFFNDEITILFLFTYSVCDEKVKRDREKDHRDLRNCNSIYTVRCEKQNAKSSRREQGVTIDPSLL